MGQKSKHGMAGFSAQVSKAEIKESTGQFLSEGWGNSNSKWSQLVSKIQFLEVAGLRLLFPCWLSVTNCSQSLKGDYTPCHTAPLSSKPAMKNVAHTESPLYTKSLSPGRAPHFLRSQLIGSGPLRVTALFSVNWFGTLIIFAKSLHKST